MEKGAVKLYPCHFVAGGWGGGMGGGGGNDLDGITLWKVDYD